MWTVSTGKGHRCLRLHRGMSTHTSNIYRAVMQCTPRCSRIRDPALLSHTVAARVFTHARVPYFSLMCQRPLWSKCQRLTHCADVLVRPTAAEDLTTPSCRKVLTRLHAFQGYCIYIIHEVNRRVFCTLSEFITRYLRANNLSDFCC